jgi:hypothetical protein
MMLDTNYTLRNQNYRCLLHNLYPYYTNTISADKHDHQFGLPLPLPPLPLPLPLPL